MERSVMCVEKIESWYVSSFVRVMRYRESNRWHRKVSSDQPLKGCPYRVITRILLSLFQWKFSSEFYSFPIWKAVKFNFITEFSEHFCLIEADRENDPLATWAMIYYSLYRIRYGICSDWKYGKHLCTLHLCITCTHNKI